MHRWANYVLVERIVDYETADFFLKLRGEASSLRKLKHCIQLYLQHVRLHIYFVEDRLEVTYRVRVEPETANHPKNSEKFFVHRRCVDIPIAHSAEGLESPVGRTDILVGDRLLNEILLDDPAVGLKVRVVSYPKPGTRHHMHHKHHRNHNSDQFSYAFVNVQQSENRVEALVELKESEESNDPDQSVEPGQFC